MIIRKAEIKDIPKLASLASHVYATTFGKGGIFPDKMVWSDEELVEQIELHKSEKAFHRAIAINKDTFLIAESNDSFIGYIGLRDPDIKVINGRQPTPNDQATNGIYIHPDYHRRGIGSKLLNAAMSQERFKKAENIYMVVWEENKPSYNFFISHGFKLAGKKEVTSSGKVVGYDFVLMRPIE